MRIYLISGEDSGDLHTGNLLKAIRLQRPGWEFRGIGGDQMAAQGMALIAHVRDINYMGFAEVLRHLGDIRKLFKQVKSDVEAWKPDAVILTDYPGFNLRIARFFHEKGIPVYYYISPQLWAWKKGRIRHIRSFVKRMLVILPFEEKFYQKEGVEVDFVGHPLLDALADQPPRQPEKGVIALLPGSRKQEIKRMLPVFLEIARQFPALKFVIAGAPSQSAAFYEEIIGDAPVELAMNQTYAVLRRAEAALVTSGTATLETAMLGVPEVVCYRGSNLSYQIGKRLIKVPFISLVNLIVGKKLVEELIQQDMNPQRLQAELRALLTPEKQAALSSGYQELREKLGGAGASATAAEKIISLQESLATS